MRTGDGRPGAGKVVTFYSYKGGTGRTTALANVAWILAANGLRVLAVDWDLEAPGLERYFHPFLDPVELANRTGVLDAVTDFRAAVARRRWSVTELRQLVPRHADVSGRVLRVDWPHFSGGGRLDVLCAGQEGAAYAEALADLDWNVFYSQDHGADFLRALRDSMAAEYDYVLVDSRTGLGDAAGICTLELPETLVVCFTLSGQGIEGAAGVAQSVARARAEQGRPVRVLPVPTRVDGSEHERFEAGRDLARQRFAGFPEGVGGEALREYWNAVTLPYRAYYAFEEVLAVFGDEPGDPQTLLAGCERLTAAVTEGAVRALPPMPGALRAAWRERYQRRRARPGRVVLVHGTAERAWAHWATEVFEAVGLQAEAHECGPKPGAAGNPALWAAGASHVVALLSELSWSPDADQLLRELEGRSGPDGQPLLRVRCGGEPGAERELDLQQLDEQLAAQLLVRAVDPELAGGQLATLRTAGFPGREPSVWNAPGRNPFFCGRGPELEQMRQLLALHGRVALLAERPGAGATELAREYAHRCRGDYDLVWWIPAADPAAARAALQLLMSRVHGPLPARSLVVLDGAGEPDELELQLPGVLGTFGESAHVLVTTSRPAWAEHAELLTVGPLDRRAAVRLLGSPEATSGSECDRLAAQLADHAPALFLAGAHLTVSGMDAEVFAQSLDPGAEPTRAVLVRGLELLQVRSPAALFVLQLCACLGGVTVARRLLRDDRLLRELEEIQPEVMDWASFAIVQGELEALGLVAADEGGELLRIDARVRHAVLERLGRAEREALVRRTHELLVARRLRLSADVDDERNWQRLEEIWQHLLPSGADRSDEAEVRGLFVDFVRYLSRRGRPGEAEHLAEALHTRWADRLPAGDWRRLRLRAEWANAVRYQGRQQEAHDLDSETLTAQRELFGAEHVHTLITASGYGGGLRALGRYREALEVDRGTLAAMTSRLGRNHVRTTSVINNFAVDHHLAGNYAEARDGHEESLRIRRAALGQIHPYTLDAMAGVARAVRELGRWREAVDRYRRVVLVMSALLDPLSWLRINRELAGALRLDGSRREALATALQVHESALLRYGPDSPTTQACLFELAANWYATGEPERAVDAARLVLDATVERTGSEHPEALCCAHNHALYLAGDGSDREQAAVALALLSPVTEALIERLGQDHPLTLSARANRAGLLALAGDVQSAMNEGSQVWEETRLRRGEDHPRALILAANLSNAWLNAGRELEGERLRIEALPKLTRALGHDHPDLSTLRQRRWVDVVLDLPVW